MTETPFTLVFSGESARKAGWILFTDGIPLDDVGLDNVDNTSDMDKPVSTAQAAADAAVLAAALLAIEDSEADLTGNTLTLTGKLTVGGGRRSAYAAKVAAYTIVPATDYCINCTTGTYSVTLPTASGIAGQEFVIKNSGTGVITIATTYSQTIDANASGSLTLNQYDSISVMSDGANWIIN
jgi:hypothetical protein